MMRLGAGCWVAALLAACQNAPLDELLEGKSCTPSGECADGYSCNAGVCSRNVPTGGGATTGNGGAGGTMTTGDGGRGGVSALGGGGVGVGAGGDGSGGDGGDGGQPTGLPIGASCNNDNQCQSGFCPNKDKVCCNVDCDDCLACVMSKTGVADGTCAPVLAGTDPNNDCPGIAGVCDGAGQCQ